MADAYESLTAEQKSVLRGIVKAAADANASPIELKAAIETAIVESGITNPQTPTDHDSIGWRQERLSLYGPTAGNVDASAKRFFQETKSMLAKRRYLDAGALAADVQRPNVKYRGRYRLAGPRADAIIRAMDGKNLDAGSDSGILGAAAGAAGEAAGAVGGVLGGAAAGTAVPGLGPVLGAAGTVLGLGSEIKSIAEVPAKFLKLAVDVVSLLFDKDTWVRIGKTLLGSSITLMGLAALIGVAVKTFSPDTYKAAKTVATKGVA